MDDMTFHGGPNPQTGPEDMFSNDLAALKMRLQSMEASLNFLNTSQIRKEAQQVPPTSAHSAWSVPSLPSSLPSGPLFWQLFTSLRTDVRGLDGRVAIVEQNLSNLEDRVDSLDPNRFTPPGSHSTQRPIPTSSYGPTSFNEQAAPVPRDYQYSPAWYPCHISHPGSNSPGAPQHTATSAWAQTTAGIAFRDREIARLEDLLNRMQDDLYDSEEMVDHKSSQIGQLKYRQECLDRQIAELQHTVQAYCDIFAMNRTEDEDRQAELHVKRARLVAADRQVHELQHALSKAVSSNRKEAEQAVFESDEKLRRLREIAERKDTVVRQQEDVIARGVDIVKEREVTIENLSNKLKISEDECRNERRERERFARLLEEKTGEIAHLKATLARENPATQSGVAVEAPTHSNVETLVEAESAPISPMPFGAQQNRRQVSGQWTPQPLDKYAKLPHEQRRAAAWELSHSPRAPTPNRSRFGQAGQLSLERDDSLTLLRKLALAREGHRTASPVIATQSGQSRRGLPLDDFEAVCATPPALPPRLSKPHNDDGPIPGVALGHQPVHPVQPGNRNPRRSFQAYVEAEDSREKRGDAA